MSPLTVGRDGTKGRSFAKEQIAERGLTDSGSVFKHRVEDWLKLSR